jgi:hypothetical protein
MTLADFIKGDPMIRTFFVAILLTSLTSFAQTKSPVASCKIITPGLITFPGEAPDVKSTTLFADGVELSEAVVNNRLTIFADFSGTDSNNKPLTKSLMAPWGMSIGSEYNQFNIYNNPTDHLPQIKMELEFLNKRTNALFSVLVIENAVDRNGNAMKRYFPTRFMCNLTQP